MSYICPNCDKEFSEIEGDFIRCMYCDSKILFKRTPAILKSFSSD
ncbi:MAG: hypothetical protein ABH803_02480 [Candidatus Micrarchaeota archaeon]